jgi:hypothetical protein
VPDPNRGGDKWDVKKRGAFSCAVCFSSDRGANERLLAGWQSANWLAPSAETMRLMSGDVVRACGTSRQGFSPARERELIRRTPALPAGRI